MSDTFKQQLRQIIPIAERWKELQAERNSIAMEGARIVRRMDELRPLCRIEAEFESAQKALEEIIALPKDKLKHQHYAEIDRQEKRVQQMQAIEAELHQVDQTLNRNKARLDAIDKELEPLNQQLDQFGELLSQIGLSESRANMRREPAPKKMTIRIEIDRRSWEQGFDDGLGGLTCCSSRWSRCGLTAPDEYSYCSGYIEGDAKRQGFSTTADKSERYILTCLICGIQGENLVAMQEHAVHAHGYEFEDHKHVIRRAVENGYIWTMVDGVDWLHAEKESKDNGH